MILGGNMPTVEQILISLKTVANTWRMLAVFWHAYFAAVILLLVVGIRFSKRIAGVLLVLPLVSVSVIAWTYFNPFNGLVYALLSIVLLVTSLKLPHEKVRIAPRWMLIPGIIMFAFGWVYPHFLETISFVPYLYASPIGLIPCATLSIVIGLLLVLDGLNSRTMLIVLGIAGSFYGLTGVFQLGVLIDIMLLLSAIFLLIIGAFRKYNGRGNA